VRSFRSCWRFNDEAVNELKDSRINPSSIYAVSVLAFSLPLVFFLVYFVTGQIVQQYWSVFWYNLVFRGMPPTIWYLFTSFCFDVLMLVSVSFLPTLTILLRNGCRHSAKNFGKCFVFLAIPAEILWHIITFLLAPAASISVDWSVSSPLWKYTIQMSWLAQLMGLVTMMYGLLDGLKKSRRNSLIDQSKM